MRSFIHSIIPTIVVFSVDPSSPRAPTRYDLDFCLSSLFLPCCRKGFGNFVNCHFFCHIAIMDFGILYIVTFSAILLIRTWNFIYWHVFCHMWLRIWNIIYCDFKISTHLFKQFLAQSIIERTCIEYYTNFAINIIPLWCSGENVLFKSYIT